MYAESPFCKPPPDNAVLWRYMDFTKFVSLLETNQLFFARADKLGDPFEGSFSRGNIERRPMLYSDLENPEDVFTTIGWYVRELRRFTLISCWHENSSESAGMWKLYSRETDGIAIKTDFNSFKQSLKNSEHVSVGQVQYVDYGQAFIPENNGLAPFLHKRQDFNHEREVRAIIQEPPVNDGKFDPSQDICDVGKYYEVDLSLLIKEVVVAPFAEDWFLELIQSVIVNRYKFDMPVVRSNLAQNPVWY